MTRGLLFALGLGLLFVAGSAGASVTQQPSMPPPRGGRSTTGYKNGQPIAVQLVEIDSEGHELSVPAAEAFFAMRAAAAASGISLHVESAFRTMEEQEWFWYCYQTKSCNDGNLAAQPGYSNHQGGTAVDISTARGTNAAWQWLVANANRFGFFATVPTEPWHWDYLG